MTNDADGHHDYVIGKPVAVFELSGTRYGYFGEESVSVRDTTCPSCREFTSTMYPVDALEHVENSDFLTMGVCPDCIKNGLTEVVVPSDRRTPSVNNPCPEGKHRIVKIHRCSDGGAGTDSPDNTIALRPNCHCRGQYLRDSAHVESLK